MEIIPFFGYSLYQMFLLFCVWSFIGWGIEVCYMTLETGEYQNRGFLNMPICPIYGFGVLMIVIFFRPIENTFFPLFLASGLLCTTFELLVGVGMEKLFNNVWWDYSHEKFNFKGYICLKVSILWGLGCVLVVRVVNPAVEKAVDMLPVKAGKIIIVIMSVLIAVDLVCSVIAVEKLNSKLRRIDEISKLMLSVSMKTGKQLAKGTILVKENVDKVIAAKDNAMDKIQDANAANIDKLRAEYERLLTERDEVTDRFIKAFPKLRSHKYSEALDHLKLKIYGKMLDFNENLEKMSKEHFEEEMQEEQDAEKSEAVHEAAVK
ncbi:MAG: hypothetical protein ACI4JJ_08405 [Huintestinicola sp.]